MQTSKPKILLRVEDSTASGDFVIEYNTVADLGKALEASLPYLVAGGGVFQARSTNLSLRLGGVKIQQERQFPKHWTAERCIAELKHLGLEFSSYSIEPGGGYVFVIL